MSTPTSLIDMASLRFRSSSDAPGHPVAEGLRQAFGLGVFGQDSPEGSLMYPRPKNPIQKNQGSLAGSLM